MPLPLCQGHQIIPSMVILCRPNPVHAHPAIIVPFVDDWPEGEWSAEYEPTPSEAHGEDESLMTYPLPPGVVDSTFSTRDNVALEKRQAAALGLTLIHLRILRALSDGEEHTYRSIQARTGYYSILAEQIRGTTSRGAEHPTSLVSRGLVLEGVSERATRQQHSRSIMTFRISPEGKALLSKLDTLTL